MLRTTTVISPIINTVAENVTLNPSLINTVAVNVSLNVKCHLQKIKESEVWSRKKISRHKSDSPRLKAAAYPIFT